MKNEKVQLPNKPKFDIVGVIHRLFKKRQTELEKLIINFLTGDGYKEFAKIQVEKQQQEFFRLQEVQRAMRLKEKFEYLEYKLNSGLELDATEKEELRFCKFFTERTSNGV